MKHVYWSSCKVPDIIVRFWRNLNFLEIFGKNLDIKFHENPSSGSRDFPYGQTDRHDAANSHSSQLRKRAWNLCLTSSINLTSISTVPKIWRRVVPESKNHIITTDGRNRWGGKPLKILTSALDGVRSQVDALSTLHFVRIAHKITWTGDGVSDLVWAWWSVNVSTAMWK